MGSAESHQAGSEPTVKYDESVAAIVNGGSYQPRNPPFRSELDIPSTNFRTQHAVVTDSSRQATDLKAVCPGLVTRQSRQLFKDNTDPYAVPVRIEKASLRYSSKHIFAINFVSRPYLRNGRAYGMVFVCLSVVGPFVRDVLRLSVKS